MNRAIKGGVAMGALALLVVLGTSCDNEVPEQEVGVQRAAVGSGDAGPDADGGASPFAGGDGSAANPYQIETCAQLQAMDLDLAASYELIWDVDCWGFDAGDGGGFRPVGASASPFTGAFDGDAWIVQNLRITRSSEDDVGLFGVTNGATIETVGSTSTDVIGNDHVGKLVGRAIATTLDEVFAVGTSHGHHHVGGLIGTMDQGTLTNSYQLGNSQCVDEKCGILIGQGLSATLTNSYGKGFVWDTDPPELTEPGFTGTRTESFFDCDEAGTCIGTDPAALRTTEIQDFAFLSGRGWDITTIWGEGTVTFGYPCLQWQWGCTAPAVCASDDTTCDGNDDDCDGTTDEDFVGGPTTCGVGACGATGTSSCSGGVLSDTCSPGTPAANDATCDGIDDDCDGMNDEDVSDTPTSCGVGACAATGTSSCVSGSLTDSCAAGTPASNDATCDGIDDDCDGSVDEDFASESTNCGAGSCAATGSTSCVNGVVEDSCTPGGPGTDDVTCDGVDDDCDGTTDEDFPVSETTCGVGGCGATGTESCVSGAVVDSCTPGTPAASDATCDAVDDDCDGTTDENFVAPLVSCGLGLCEQTGTAACVSGRVTQTCTPGTPAPDTTCDGMDDDCDGSVDEAFLFRASSCGVGVCAATGIEGCVSGSVVDNCAPGAPVSTIDLCNGLDDDCDGMVDEDFGPTTTVCGTGACGATGSTACIAGLIVDSCVPGAPAASDDSCDGIDQNCDGVADEGYVPTCSGSDRTACVGGVVTTSACDDGDVCNGAESCSAGACAPGTPLSLDDGNPCTTDTCDPITGVAHTAVAVGTDCSDGNVCNGAETCGLEPINLFRNPSFEAIPGTVFGQGIMPSEWDVWEGSPDTYSNDESYGLSPPSFGHFPTQLARTGLRFVAGWSNGPEVFAQTLTAPLIPGESYTIGAWLITGEVFDQPGGYEIRLANAAGTTVVPVGAFAESGAVGDPWVQRSFTFIAPTNADVLPVLLFVPLDNPTTTLSAYNGVDDVSLFQDSVPPAAVCSAVAPSFSDGNPCTTDTCDPISGIVNTPVGFGTSCADAAFCNGEEICDEAATCQADFDEDIEDQNLCTVDSCDPVALVSNIPVAPGTPCGDGGTCDAAANCIGDTNGSPSITSTAVTTLVLDGVTETASYVYDAVATDPENDALTWSLVDGPLGITLGSSGEVRWDANANDFGSHPVRIRVTDPFGHTGDQDFVLTVSFGNRAPVFDTMPLTQSTADDPYGYAATATDPDGDSPLTWSLPTAPAGMAVSPAGVASWSPTEADVGSHPVTLRVADPSGAFAEQNYVLVIVTGQEPPTFVTTPTFTASPGTLYSYDAEATDPDPGDSVTYSLDLAPSGMTVDPSSGLVSWTPAHAQIGNNTVRLLATDTTSRVAIQEFVIAVGGTNDPPVIVSTPVFEAIPDALYTYTIVADDPENDPVSYGLVSGPSGMSVDPISGVVSWNPTASDLGTTPVTVSATDSLGASATQSYALRVATNIAPRFTSAPVENGTQGELYTYEPIAVDPDPGDTVTFVLQEGPTGLFFEPVSGALRWTPTPNDVGVHPVNIAAVDSAGLADVQLFSITVANVNDGPRIVSSPVRSATVGAPYVYDVDAQDPDPLDAVTYSLVTAPPGMTIDSGNGLIQWIPGTIGSESVEVRADDSTGLFDTQAFLLDVGADDAGPTVTLTASPRTFAPGGSSVLTVTASDDVGIATTTLTVDGVALPLSAGTATYTTTVTGPHLAVAQATDVNGNLGQASLTLGVTDSADTTPPTVDLESPAEDDVLTYLHDVVGTVEDDNLLGYTVSLRRTNEDTFVEVFGGATTVTSDVLGVLDTTLLENGYYELRLRAEDVNGLTAEDSVRIRVDGQAKVGVVELSFVDMAVNMVGIPLTVVRSYDSRRKDVGDFGYGWELEIQEGYVTHNRPIGEGFGITEGPPPLALPCQETPEAASHFTEVRISDREVYIFRPVVTNLARLSGACIGDVFYELVDGTLDGAELRILGENQVEYQEGTFSLIGLTSRVLFDPADVELLTPDGRLFHVNTDTGITFLSDGSGNNLQIRPEGIFHSDGASLQIERDAEGRIERIRDPMQHVVEYQYDAAGDLVGVVDVLGGVTQFLYEEPSFPHHLTTIIDRRGNRVAAMDYDGEGRLQELCDAEAACTTNSYDLSARTQVTTDATSRPVTYTYDVRGNVTQEVDGLGNLTTRTYDVHGNELTVTDPEGNVTTRTYDPVFQLSLTSETTPVPAGRDPADYTTTWTYESNGRRKTVTYPSGGGLEWDYLSNVFPPIRLRDDAGNVIWERTLGALGIPLTHTDRFGTETYEYTRSFAVPSRVTDTFGNVTDIEVDGNHNITQMTRTFDGNPLVSTFTYDPAGRRTSADYGNGLTVAYQYGLENDWTQISGPTFGTVQREYSSTGRLSAWTMPNGDQGSRLYDGAGRVLEEVDEVGNLTRSSYDAAGRLASTYDQALDATTTFERDDAGKLTARVDAESHRTEFTWDANELRQTRDARGELTTFGTTPTQQTTTDPLLRTTTRNLTPLGLPASTVFPGGGTVTPTYLGTTAVDESSRFLQTWTDEESRVRTLGYDTRSGLTSATFLGRTEAWTYRYADTLRGEITFDIESGTVGLENSDARQEPYRFSGGSEDLPAPPELGERLRTRQLDRIVTPSGEITEHTFDVQGRRTSTSYPNGSTGSWAYGSDGDVDLQTWPSGDTLNFTHDAAGNELSRTAGTGETRSVTYGPTSRIDQVVGPTGTIDYTYDAAGRVTTVSTPAGGSVESDVQYAYDDLGQITEVTVVVGASRYTTTYQYDPIGNITQITDPLGGITTQVFDAAGRRTSRTLPNGVVTTWTYDDRDRITGVDHTHPPTTSTLASRSYTRTLSGEPTRIDREDGSYIEVTYDSANRIEREIHRNPSGTIVTEKSYTYDIDGNRVSKTVDGVTESYIYDPGAELVRIEVGGAATETFTYDNGGRTTAIARPGQNYALAYDPLFTNDGGGVTAIADGTTTTDYAFDGEGRRERVDNGTTERRYLIAPSPGAGYESVHAVLDELNALVMAYVYIDDQPLLRFDSAGNATYYLEDAMGSIVGLAGATGASTAVFHYDAFGNLLASSGSASTLLTSTLGDFRFHAMWLDPTELYYVRARTYDPQTGRFLTWDSAPSLRLDPETIRGFDFARFNPFVWLDPSGRTSLPDIGAAQSAQRSLQSTATAVFRAQLTIARATANSLRGTRFVGLARNQVFSTLTRQAVRNAFTRIGLRPSNHFIARVFHPRTRALGVNSLRGIETILRRGVLVESHSGAYAVVHRGLAIVFDPKTRILITLTPWTF